MNHNYIKVLISITLIGLAACKTEIEEIRPGGESAGVNFYNAAEVLNVRQELRVRNMVFINDSIPQAPFIRFPEFDEVTDRMVADKRQYPYNRTGTIFNNPGIVPDNYQYVYYMPMELGDYKFIFTGANKNYLKDVQSNLSSTNNRQCFYLVEDPATNHDYRIVNIPETYSGVPGKIRVRIVHLGPDSPELNVKLLDENGNLQEAGLPQRLSFGVYSDYVEINPERAHRGSGLILSIADVSAPETPVLNAVVPAAPNGSFVVVIQGYRNTTTRQVAIGHNTNGSTLFTEVSVAANFRTTLRRTF